MVLGGQHFIKEVLGRLKGEILQREEVSSRRELQGSWRSEKIIDAVSSCLGISRDEVFQDRKDYRNMAIYLMKVQTGMTNGDIGNLFGAMSYSAVAKAYARFSTRLSEDKTLRKKVGQVSALLSTFKG
jgi:chromosomal replication initiation ATPase DnaA